MTSDALDDGATLPARRPPRGRSQPGGTDRDAERGLHAPGSRQLQAQSPPQAPARTRARTLAPTLAQTAPRLPAPLLGEMADMLAWPLLVLRRDAALLHANLAARRLLARGHPLQHAADGRVHASDAALQPGLLAALATAAGDRQRSVLQWPGRAGMEATGLTLAPLSGRHSDHHAGGDGSAAPVLLHITTADSQTADLPAFGAQHGFSGAEQRLLPRLALAESSAQAAAALGLARPTVRSQTASLRRKTGHRSVAGLACTLARLPPTAPAPVPVPVAAVLTVESGAPSTTVKFDITQRRG